MIRVPREILKVIEPLREAGFLAFLVGGCVRDLLLGQKPKDWDVTTNATPEQIAGLFPKTFYENDYGTVTVVNEKTDEESLRHVEITPFRLEAKYSDQRHPDSVIFSDKIEDDLKRRDFTLNAIAYNPSKGQITDPYNGQRAIKDKIIVAVGNPDERFQEDPLRMLRAIRLASQLSFAIANETAGSILNNHALIKVIAKERVRDEFNKIIMSSRPMIGLVLANKLGVLQHILPEIEEGVHVKQNGEHIYDVWEHSLRGLQHAADKNYQLHVRLAVLLHDVGKPRTRRWSNEKNDYTFYGHDVVGAKMAEKILERLKFPRKTIEVVSKLVRYHMFFSDISKITLSAVRRVIRNVSRENIWDLMSVRMCDRVGMGRPIESPYRLRKYQSMIEEALRSPTSVSMLRIGGENVLCETGFKPGPKIGLILHALLEEVLDNPNLNEEEYLIGRVRELAQLDDVELKKLGDRGKEKKTGVEQAELRKIRSKFRVR